jgi:hypothetical protein
MDAYQPQGTSFGMTTDYQERISYDPNGNILTYNRNKHNGQAMDQLTYNYHPTKKNQLQQVRDAISHQADSNDIDDQTHAQNYKYDAIGNLIRDEQENMDIFWTPTGKISKINQGNKKITLIFAYACPVKYGNPMGNRISKTVMDMTGKRNPATTYYTRDAQGNTMAVYDNTSLKNDIEICELDRPYLEQITRNIITFKAKSLIAEEEDFYQNSINEFISQNWQGDSCKYKYMNLMSEKNIPCFIDQEDYNIIQQLYYQDFEYFQSMETTDRKLYLSQKYNEHNENMGDRTYCFIQELSIAMVQPIDEFEAWLMNQKRTDFRTKLDEFYTELAQTSIYYGILNDTAYQDSLFWQEQHLYGSSRLGMAKPELEITNYTPSNQISYTSNFRNYELTNHLGNVLSTIKDEKQQIDANNDGIVDYYEPIVITATDYYPFGMVMPNRSFSISKPYSFGFNGQLRDNEVYGVGNLNTALFWQYDTRLGRRWNVDPKPRVGISDYSVMDGNPIWKNDVLGDEPNKKEAWAMSKIVYGKNDKATAKARKILEKGGWEISKETFDIQKRSNENGFKSELFVRTDKEGTEYAYATTGTEKGDKSDWTKGNIPQLIGLSEQYNLSMENAKLIRDGTRGKELTFTGHSLGGGLAAANAYATGGKAITFNPAGVSGLTMATIAVNYGFKMVFAKIDAHILLTDPLNMFNAITTRTDGTKHLYKPTDGASYKDGHDLDNLGKSLGIK